MFGPVAQLIRKPWFAPVALLALFVAAYWVPLQVMVSTWWTNDDYSYGFLIPLISAYLLWDRRQLLKTMPVGSSWRVFPLLVMFVLLSLYGILGSSGNISMPSIPILIVLFSAFCFGLRIAKQTLLPLGFLIFMIPIPAVLERTLGIFLKSISSKLGGEIIASLDIPVHVSGNIIDLGVTQLQVVDACSGLRYLFPLFALGIVYAYFFERITWKRVFCVFATIPIAVFTNALRIGLTGILANSYGVSVAEGFFHGSSAFVLFLVAFACLFIVGRLLRLLPPRHGSARTKDDPLNEPPNDPPGPRTQSYAAFAVSAALIIMVGLFSLSTKALPAIKIRGGIDRFPVAFNQWQGRSQPVDPKIVVESGAEESFSGLYQNPHFGEISLYIGYRSTAFLSNENFFHSPTVCLPASGWEPVSTGTRIVTDVPSFGNLHVSTMVIGQSGGKELVYYWFQTKSQATPDKNINRFDLSIHAIKRDNTHDLFIRPITPIYRGENVEDAQKRMDQFVRDVMGALLRFLKENQYEEKS